MSLTSVASLLIIAFVIEEVYLMGPTPTKDVIRNGFGTIQEVQYTFGQTVPPHHLTSNQETYDFTNKRYFYIPNYERSRIVHHPALTTSATDMKHSLEIAQVWLMKSIPQSKPGELYLLGLVFYENGLEEGISPTMIAKVDDPSDFESATFETLMKLYGTSFKVVGDDFHYEQTHWTHHVIIGSKPEVKFPFE